MPTERWHRLEQIFADAVVLPASTRADFLADRCGADVQMRDEIWSLLAAEEHVGDFLSAPALDLFARQILREGWSVQPGQRIGSYTVARRLGAGGMGEVWRARDERLGRDVAIKLLLPHPADPEQRVQAFKREAYAAGSLNHVNVLTVHDVGDHGDAPYLVSECLEGEPLRARLGAGPLSVDAALDVALQVARGLGAAHGRGIVHRDLKPENIFVVRDGPVKILDFGLASLHDGPAPGGVTDIPAQTTRSLAAGTAGYMAPEQLQGQAVDRRADIFSLGVVLHEMLIGHPPFRANSTVATLHAVLNSHPSDLSREDPLIPTDLSLIVHRCLNKSPGDRFATVADVISALEAVIRARSLPPAPGLLALLRQPLVIATVLLAGLAVAAGAWRWRVVAARGRWARTVAAPEVEQLLNRDDFARAFPLARTALDAAPDDAHLQQLWLNISTPVDLTSEPAGADVAFAPYGTTAPSWTPLGRTPLRSVRIPSGLMQLRISKQGFQPIEVSGAPGALQRYRMDPVDQVPAGMVRVLAGRDRVRFGAIGDLEDFWIDRFEVTNRQFKEFVDHGGYRRRDYWRERFLENGRMLPWEEAIARFTDRSGRPGPSTWASGTYPEGRAAFPVDGVSWYEAAAYAAYAGKSLPTMYHWFRAAGFGRFDGILTASNFAGKGPAPVGRHRGLGPFGSYDMAGNVKEWCWTESNGRRALLGGAWNEPSYLFDKHEAKDPFDRAVGYGFRAAKYLGSLPPAVSAPVRPDEIVVDYRKFEPVDDAMFSVFQRLYAYDGAALNTVVEASEEREIWRRYTVVFDTAYGERMRAHLFLPRKGTAPYQTVIFFPAGDAFLVRASRDMSLAWLDFIIRSGRAFLYPVYQGTYERATTEQKGPNTDRDRRIAWSRDLGRSIDYLESRPDIDLDRLALYAVSAGSQAGVILTALEPRLKTSVLQASGMRSVTAPEINPLNFAPRVRIPLLMLNGRHDFELPLETSQNPLFALLGTRPEDKRHLLFPSGHVIPLEDVVREILPWLDRYLGPVIRSPSAAGPATGPPRGN